MFEKKNEDNIIEELGLQQNNIETKDLKVFIGLPLVKAKKMSEFEFLTNIKNQEISQNQENRKGYLIQYSDGYISWSPKNEFEAAYREMKITVNFSINT